jgi:hypothetical protein
MPDINIKFAKLLTSGSSSLLDRYNAMTQHTLDNGADAARLTLHYLQDLSQANMNTLLQRVRQTGATHLYAFDPASWKAQCTLGNDYRVNLFAILLDMQRNMVEDGSSALDDGYKQWQKIGASWPDAACTPHSRPATQE